MAAGVSRAAAGGGTGPAVDGLPGVKDGGMAMEAYVEAITPGTSPERREQIRQELIAYCGFDTLAMVRVWEFFSGSLPAGSAAIDSRVRPQP